MGLIGMNYCGVLHDGSDPVVARSKAWDCGSSLVGVGGPHPAGGIDVWL